MKKNVIMILMAVAAVGMLFTSCNKDPEELILGTWNVDTEMSYHIREGIAPMAQSYYCDTMSSDTSSWTFNADGSLYITTVVHGRSWTDTTTYSIADDKITVPLWSTFDIEKLTQKALILHYFFSKEEETWWKKNTDHIEFTR